MREAEGDEVTKGERKNGGTGNLRDLEEERDGGSCTGRIEWGIDEKIEERGKEVRGV